MTRDEILGRIYAHTDFALPPRPFLEAILSVAYQDATINLLSVLPEYRLKLTGSYQDVWNSHVSNSFIPNSVLSSLFSVFSDYIRLTDLDSDRPIFLLSNRLIFESFRNSSFTYACVFDDGGGKRFRFNKFNGFFKCEYVKVLNDDLVDDVSISFVVDAVLRRVIQKVRMNTPLVIPQFADSNPSEGRDG